MAVSVVLFAAHLAEIGLYAVVYAAAEHWFNLGTFSGEPVTTGVDYFYFSAITYTSLGIGDIFPTEHLRFLTGVEALGRSPADRLVGLIPICINEQALEVAPLRRS